MTELPIFSITIGKRHRKSVGDIASLAASIERVGLLHPPVDHARRQADRGRAPHSRVRITRLEARAGSDRQPRQRDARRACRERRARAVPAERDRGDPA